MIIKNSGIYMIKNKINGKFYIGSSTNLHNRKNQHWARVRNGSHENKTLLRSFNKHGEDSFEFIIIENVIIDDFKYLIKREQWWMDYYQPYQKNGYNQSKVAFGFKPLTDIIDPNKIYLVYDLKGNLLNKFKTIKECSDTMKMNYNYIQHRIYDNDAGKKLEVVRYVAYDNLIFMSEHKDSEINIKIKTNRKFLIEENVLTGEKTEYYGMVSVANMLGIGKYSFNGIIRNKRIYKNHKYYYESY